MRRVVRVPVRVGVIVRMGVIVVGRMAAVPMRRRHLRPGGRDREAQAPQDAVVVLRCRAGDARIDGPHAGAHALKMLGKGIQQRGGEHVAGDAAECVEVDVHGLSVGSNRLPDAVQIGRRRPKARDAAPSRRRGVSPSAQIEPPSVDATAPDRACAAERFEGLPLVSSRRRVL